MEVHIARRVESTPLAQSHALLPLFEAIINSIHAIEDASISGGHIEIRLQRDLSLLPADPHHNYVPDVRNITITDNGIGFTKKNVESFRMVDTPHKADRGGKGLGRLTWLKAFDRVEVESVFEEDGEVYRCAFDFERTAAGVERLVRERTSGQPNKTSVRLLNYLKGYQQHCPKRAETIARRVIEHCFQYFLFERMPALFIHDPDGGAETLDVVAL